MSPLGEVHESSRRSPWFLSEKSVSPLRVDYSDIIGNKSILLYLLISSSPHLLTSSPPEKSLTDGLQQLQKAAFALPAEIGQPNDALHHRALLLADFAHQFAFMHFYERSIEQIIIVAKYRQLVVVLIVEVDGGGAQLVTPKSDAADIHVVAKITLVGFLIEKLDTKQAVLANRVDEECQLPIEVHE